MCGLAGVARIAGSDVGRLGPAGSMAATLRHRGPDGDGLVLRSGCAFGFRRLAIVGLGADSPPYANEDGTVWTVCNGEIYNADALRAELTARGHRFRTAVDTEVLPHLYEEHGADLAPRLDGMFAFAIWDESRRTLVLGRDRAGEKPLFYSEAGGELVFGSELRAILEHPGVSRALDPVSLRRYLLHGYFPAPHTPFAGIRKLPAAHTLTLREGRIDIRRYWDLADAYAAPRLEGSLDDLAARVDAAIGEAVRRRRRSDVPVGVFLSGGIDSTTVLAHLTEQTGRGVPAFGLGHRDAAFDESRFARETAAHYGADYRDLVLGPSDLEDGLRRVTELFDEPLADASTIPTHLLSSMARRHVKVILSGEGGDELFAGYPTYIGDAFAERYRSLPRPLRATLAAGARRLTRTSMGNVGLDFLLKRFVDWAELPRIERHHTWFGCIPPARHAQLLAPQVAARLAGDDPFEAARRTLSGRTFPDGLSQLLYSDFVMYLQDDLLTKVDRASMLASLEVRAPFLDHDLAELAARLPSRAKLRGRRTKIVLRRAVRRRLPPEVLARRKRGFNIPFSRWLCEGLGQRLLAERFAIERVEARGLFSAAGVRALVGEHVARQADHGKAIFALVALDAWCDRMSGPGAPIELAASESVPEARALAPGRS